MSIENISHLCTNSFGLAGGSSSREEPAGDKLIQCMTCFSDVSKSLTSTMDCGHVFCNDCWLQHFRCKIGDGQARSLRCEQRQVTTSPPTAKVSCSLPCSRGALPSRVGTQNQGCIELQLLDGRSNGVTPVTRALTHSLGMQALTAVVQKLLRVAFGAQALPYSMP